MDSPWTQVFRGRASVYALDEDTKQWAERGTSGTIIMYQSNTDRDDVRIKWEKSDTEVWWKLTSSKLKPKKERALVLKAWAVNTNQQEILAIRFSHQEAAITFAKKYHRIFPLAVSIDIDNIFNQPSPASSNVPAKKMENVNGHELPPKLRSHLAAKKSKNLSISSLPGSVLDDNEQRFQQFQPMYGQNAHQGKPPPAPPRQAKLRQPPPKRQSNIIPAIDEDEPLNLNVNINQPRVSLTDAKDLPEEPESPLDQNQAKLNNKRVVKADPNMRPPIWAHNQHQPQQHNHPLQYNQNGQLIQSWKCSVCTYQNSEGVAKCSMCGLPNPPQKPGPQAPNVDNNDYHDDDEDMMMMQHGQMQPGPRGQHGRQESKNKWQCSACTFSNHAWTDRCEVCQAKRRIDEEKEAGAQGLKKDPQAAALHDGFMEQMSPRQHMMNNQQPVVPPMYNVPVGGAGGAVPAGHGGNMFSFQQQQPPQQAQFGEWSCPICTLSNSYQNMRCDACNTARNVGPGPQAMQQPMQQPMQPQMGPQGVPQPINPMEVQQSMDQMMHRLMYDPQPSFHAYNDPFAKMMNMSMHHENPSNMNLIYGTDDDIFQGNGGWENMQGGDDYFESTLEDFSRAASDIACYNDQPSGVFSTLRSVAKKLLKEDARYRTLDTTNPKVMERLIGFEGVLDFLLLLGFESDALGMKLICRKKPSERCVHDAITVLNSYQNRFRMTDNGYDPEQMMRMMQQQQAYPMQPYGQPMGYGAGGMNYGGQMGGGPVGPYAQQMANNNGNMLQYGGQQGGSYPDPNKPQYGDYIDEMEQDINQPQPMQYQMTKDGWDDDDIQNNNNANNEKKNDILTLEQIILWSTHENMQDNDTMETLIMTHKLFTESLTLLQQLRKRFFVPIPQEFIDKPEAEKKQLIHDFQSNVQKRIQLKVIKALRDWMKHYWSEDFHEKDQMQDELTEWLRELSVYNQLEIHNVNCLWVQKLYEAVKKEYIRLKNIDWKQELHIKMNILREFDDIEVPDNTKIQKILTQSTAEELADQITLLDYTLFSRIQPRECVHQRWKDASKKHEAPNIISLVEQFNAFANFIQIQILTETTLRKRSLAMKRIVKMGEHFRVTRNYNALCAVFSALNAAPIHRLKLAWAKVPDKTRAIFARWATIFARDGNHRALRALLRKAGGNPCIPHIGVFLQDLVFIDEGNQGHIQVKAFNNNLMLNFNKCVRIADRVKNLQLFQNHKYSSKIKVNRLTQKVILMEFEKFKNWTEDQLWDLSTLVKRQDTEENRQVFGPLFGNKHNSVPIKEIQGLQQAQPVAENEQNQNQNADANEQKAQNQNPNADESNPLLSD